MSEWKATPVDDEYKIHLCPRCNGNTETLIKIEDEIEYNSAERCPKCRWIVDFEVIPFAAVNY